ncbi:MAG: pyrimidine 5'-nucleotidase [Paracoccaceae bacterium]
MINAQFNHIRTWVFDLDNTLYPPEAALFDQIRLRMTDWVMSETNTSRPEADRLRDEYWQTYGTTLAGLMAEHNVDPAPYLHDVHDIDLTHLEQDPALAAGISALPGRKIVYTNGSSSYAERVLTACGLGSVFDAVYGVEHADFKPKPEQAAFETVFAIDGVQADVAAMFEDDPRNLEAPHAMGMRTVLVGPEAVTAPYIHHHTDDLTEFLHRLTD